MKILCIGQEWRGSNSSGLFYALSRQGCLTNVINEQIYVSAAATQFLLKAVHRVLRPFQVRDFNVLLRRQFDAFQPDLVLVYKGPYLLPETITAWKKRGVPVVVFYPDVSFMAHGPYIPRCLPLYDHVFTTKTFAAADLAQHFGYPATQVSFIPHGYDPLVHRPLDQVPDNFKCQASFIGNYSPWKASLLEQLIEGIPALDLKIWGGTWGQYQGAMLRPYIQGQALLGDAYAAAINGSTINLGILSEQVRGASSGDQITSRTFHIPGAKGFLLHQRTPEALQHFQENQEAAFFEGPEELAEKVQFYLVHPEELQQVADRGHARAQREYALDARARQLLEVLRSKQIIN